MLAKAKNVIKELVSTIDTEIVACVIGKILAAEDTLLGRDTKVDGE